jgi:hypothetical protein
MSASPLSTPLARELLTREMSDGRGLVPAADAVYRRLHESLSRSIGEAGYLALVARAMSSARERHSPLATVAPGGAPGPWLTGLDKSVADYGDEAATEAMIEALAELIELLSRFVGRTLAVRLIQRGWPEHIQIDQTSGRPEEQNG